ncbi:hypothetical protein MKX01_036845 [Papaver californicum]|nr:hypothetical protein MKX01_036845 [Papaver californicum]
MDTVRNTSWLFLCVLVFGFVVCNKPHLTTAADTISPGDSLTGDQTIISKDQHFELGFLKPGNKSDNHYIGIWYKKVSVQTVVWVANRDAPILDPSSSNFTFLDGNLVLLDILSITPIWSTHLASNTAYIPEVVLGDDGNLVLRDAFNPNAVYWQSFDYPTNTLLPGGKLGFNKRTHQIQQLTSWRSREDPAMGSYNWILGPNRRSQLAIYWKKSKEIWKSGEWNESSKTFSFLPEMRFNFEFNFSVISNVNESYFTYSLVNKSMISRFVIDVSGQIKEFTWLESKNEWTLLSVQPKRLCDVYSICGPFGNCNQDTWKCDCLPGFDSTGGCVRKTPLQCEKKDVFFTILASKLPDKPRFPPIYGAEECKSACESSCGCIAYAFVNNGCRYWGEDIINFSQFTPSGGTSFNLKLAANDIPSTVPVSSSPIPVSSAQGN